MWDSKDKCYDKQTFVCNSQDTHYGKKIGDFQIISRTLNRLTFLLIANYVFNVGQCKIVKRWNMQQPPISLVGYEQKWKSVYGPTNFFFQIKAFNKLFIMSELWQLLSSLFFSHSVGSYRKFKQVWKTHQGIKPQVIYKPHCHYQIFYPLDNGVYLRERT